MLQKRLTKRLVERVLSCWMGALVATLLAACSSVPFVAQAESSGLPIVRAIDGTDRAFGHDNPTLALNLSSVADYNPGMQFLDLMKMSRPWIGHLPDQWGGMTYEELKQQGYLDQDGWVRSIPPGLAKVGTVFSWGNYLEAAHTRVGRYVLTYDGRGEIVLGGDAKIFSQGHGRIVFENTKGGNWWIDIVSTDPNQTGNYIRNITVVREEHIALFMAGAVFNPDWVELVADVRLLRFMDWMMTNDSHIRTWDDLASETGPLGNTGSPLSYMVRLANEAGTDAWFSMPHQAEPELIRQIAVYVRDNLDPRLTVYSEWSNEVWNWQFDQTHYVLGLAEREWGDRNLYRDYIAKKAVQSALIWKDVFKDQPDRLRTVFATHPANPNHTRIVLAADGWRKNEPAGYIPPGSVFDALAMTSYFGTSLTSDPEEREMFRRALNNPNVDNNDYITDRMRNRRFSRSIPMIGQFMREQKAIAEDYGMELILYEGGQHVHQLIKPQSQSSTLSKEDIELMDSVLVNYVPTRQMAELYQELWDLWESIGDGPFMQYADINKPTRFGTWGLYGFVGDRSPRSDLLNRLNKTRSPWWDGAVADAKYQHGAIFYGTNQADQLVGTREEDYLIGEQGDDVLTGGPGDDGMHGGAGTDRVVVSGTSDQYLIRPAPTGVFLIGPDGRDRLVSIELITFDDGVMSLDQVSTTQ